jgi:hypothetical protein
MIVTGLQFTVDVRMVQVRSNKRRLLNNSIYLLVPICSEQENGSYSAGALKS